MTQDEYIVEPWLSFLVDTEMRASAEVVLTGSDYVAQWGQRYPDKAEALIASNSLNTVYEKSDYFTLIKRALGDVNDEKSLHKALRFFRQREMVRIIWRDLAGWSDLSETMADLSALAEACIQSTLAILTPWLEADFGTPFDTYGERQSLVVLAMGKLGAGELNLSSDIDLIFCYPEAGETQGGRRSLSHDVFFTRLGQKLIQALDLITAEGFVFRVDMRLRPFGDSGALALSFDAMEDYYQTQGREWERYAMIKARPISGDEKQKVDLMSLLRPFVYRRYLDYGVFSALREMKTMIAGQLVKKELQDNIKLGSGGIREIEFIGQVFQLIYGGRDLALQQRPILTILSLLAQRGVLAEDGVNKLKQAYVFLRRTEHRIQAWTDKQSHLLPNDNDARARLASLMGFENWQAFYHALTVHRDCVQSHFQSLLALPFQNESASDVISLISSDYSQKKALLDSLGFVEADNCLAKIDAMLETPHCRNLNETGRVRLVRLLPRVIEAVADVDNPDQCLVRIITLIDSIMRRSAYMSLLVENSSVLFHLVQLCAASAWISDYLVRYPILLDQLLDPESLYALANRQEMTETLAFLLSSVNDDDLEQQMEKLREFKHIETLHIAATDISNLVPLMEVANQLSNVAELVINQAMCIAWQYLAKKHGFPPDTDYADLSLSGFSVIAYGKLGGLELGYGSDLDLVFIYDDGKKGLTNGDKPIDALLFYTRLAQRMIHILTTRMVNGLLFDIDIRLRPNGESGLLVSSLSGFADYQKDEAWVWEHQAIVRARCVAGDSRLEREITSIRQQVLQKQRDQTALALDVSAMRAKMRENLDKSTRQVFDLKHGVGGITDIEFMVQYAVLAWSPIHSELLDYSDNVRILAVLSATEKLSSDDATLLSEAYTFYRNKVNHCVLQDQPAIVAWAEVIMYQPQVAKLWQTWLS